MRLIRVPSSSLRPWFKLNTWGQACQRRLLTHFQNGCYLGLWGIDMHILFWGGKNKTQIGTVKVCLYISITSFERWMIWERKEQKGSWDLTYFHFFPNLPSQGMLALVLNCIDRLNIYNSIAHFAGIAREESGMAWKEILNLLYKLLGKYMPRALSLGRWLWRSIGIFVPGRGSPKGGLLSNIQKWVV